MSDEKCFAEKLWNGTTRVRCPKKAFASDYTWRQTVGYVSDKEKVFGIKMLWPSSYSPNDIFEAALDVVADSANFIKQAKGQVIIFEGEMSDGVKARIYIDEKIKKIINAFPAWVQ